LLDRQLECHKYDIGVKNDSRTMRSVDTGSARHRSPKLARSQGRRTLVEQEVKKAAAHVFASKGIATASLGDVADELGTARTALYYYYKSKDDLLVALIRECSAEARQILADAGAGSDGDGSADHESFPARLWEVVRRLTIFTIERPERVRLLDAAAELPPAAERTARKLNHQFFSDLEKLIRGGVDSGAFRRIDTGVAAHAIVGSTRSLAWWFDRRGTRDADYVARQIADSAVSGLLVQSWEQPPASVLAAAAQLKEDVDSLVNSLSGNPV
jgi:TetR/AcrR family transcriptional regulator, cholesterol catabolism regulator